MPLLIDFPVGESAFVLGPRAQLIGVGGGDGGGSGGSGVILNAGSSFGYAARVGENVRLLPELAIVYPLVAGARGGGEGGTAFVGGGALFTFNFGILIGGR